MLSEYFGEVMSSFMPRIWSLACGAAILPAVHAERPPGRRRRRERRRREKKKVIDKSLGSCSAHFPKAEQVAGPSVGARTLRPAMGRTCAAAALGRAGCRIHWVRGRSSRLFLFGRRWEKDERRRLSAAPVMTSFRL